MPCVRSGAHKMFHAREIRGAPSNSCATRREGNSRRASKFPRKIFVFFAICIETCCGIAGSPSTGQPSVTVSVTPPSANVLLGATQQFQCVVSGSSDAAVTWEVNGVHGGTSSNGTISAAGLYTAPAAMPSQPSVTVTAVSHANAADSGSASVTLQDNFTISVTPNPANVPTGGVQVFTAAISASGDPAAGFNWSVNGISGGNSTVGTIAVTSATTALYL